MSEAARLAAPPAVWQDTRGIVVAAGSTLIVFSDLVLVLVLVLVLILTSVSCVADTSTQREVVVECFAPYDDHRWVNIGKVGRGGGD